ncbi:MAG: UMP kinase [Planctomycetes bacterium]|nr:UMP kinase [Planctomycetota bacterium]
MPAPVYKRVVLKCSGEAFCKEEGKGLDIEEVSHIGAQILAASRSGVQVGVVVGGGNFLRGAQLSTKGISAATGDYMGMLATVINALALQDVLEHLGGETRVLTAVPMQAMAEPFIRRRAIRHLEKGRIVILAAGTGNPHFTTDTAAALRSTEIGADALLKATKVDGVYDSDPKINPHAKKFEHLTYLDVLNRGLRVMDSTAISLCMDNRIKILVFNLKKEGNILKAVSGQSIGTLISAG